MSDTTTIGGDLGLPVAAQVWVFPSGGAVMRPGDVRVIATVAGEGGGAIHLARSVRDKDTFEVWLAGEYGGGQATAESFDTWHEAYFSGLNLLRLLLQHAVNAVQFAADLAAFTAPHPCPECLRTDEHEPGCPLVARRDPVALAGRPREAGLGEEA